MSTATLPIDSINGSPLTDEQTLINRILRRAAARGLRFGTWKPPAVEKTVAPTTSSSRSA